MIQHGDAVILDRIRRLLLGILTLGLAGTAIDLALLAHVEDVWQYAPFGVIAVAVAAMVWRLATARRPAVQAVRLAMCLLLITGPAGVVLHYRANMEFQLDMDPSLGGLMLMSKVLQAKAPPAMAPLNLSLIGLVGLVAVYRDGAARQTM